MDESTRCVSIFFLLSLSDAPQQPGKYVHACIHARAQVNGSAADEIGVKKCWPRPCWGNLATLGFGYSCFRQSLTVFFFTHRSIPCAAGRGVRNYISTTRHRLQRKFRPGRVYYSGAALVGWFLGNLKRIRLYQCTVFFFAGATRPSPE